MIDCQDEKDEDKCRNRLIHYDNDYSRNVLVERGKDGTLKFGGTVNIEIVLKNIRSVDTAQMHFTSNFVLWLKWTDPRLTFWNLKKTDNMNRLDAPGIWTPSILF